MVAFSRTPCASLRVRALVGGLLVFCIGMLPTVARACRCDPKQPPTVALSDAAAVFVGEVVAMTQAPLEAQTSKWVKPGPRYEVEFRATRWYKGEENKTIRLTTAVRKGQCGRAFAIGETYLVYAGDRRGALSDTICSQTKPLAQASEDLEMLDHPEKYTHVKRTHAGCHHGDSPEEIAAGHAREQSTSPIDATATAAIREHATTEPIPAAENRPAPLSEPLVQTQKRGCACAAAPNSGQSPMFFALMLFAATVRRRRYRAARRAS